MNSLVIYDSAYGNTAKIAEALRGSLDTYGISSMKQVNSVTESDLRDLDLLVIGSPTQGGRPTTAIQQFIDGLLKELLNNTNIAIFDTRFDINEQKFGLRLLMKTIGYAATKMAKDIRENGSNVISEPTGFIVIEKEGPLREGEIERASDWAVQLAVVSRQTLPIDI